jgi:hypothetical protein
VPKVIEPFCVVEPYIRDHDVQAMIGDVENVVRRYPGRSLLIAAGVGFLLGRALKPGTRSAPMEYDRPLSNIFQDVIRNVQEIIRSEVRLAKTEIKEEVVKTRIALAWLSAGACAALYAVSFLLLTIVYALENILPAWLAGFIVAVALGAGAAILIGIGRTRLSQVEPKPDKTIQTMKENIEWAKHPTR